MITGGATYKSAVAPKAPGHWGRWYLDEKLPVSLNIMLTPWFEYWIDLETCRTQRYRDNWLSHMAEKSLLSPEDIDDLSRAFADLLGHGIIKNIKLR